VLYKTIERLETNPVLVNVNKLKLEIYMESEVQKKEQQMSVYWKKSVVEFRKQIFTHRKMMKDVNYRNHI
jgi:hypothetical protein